MGTATARLAWGLLIGGVLICCASCSPGPSTGNLDSADDPPQAMDLPRDFRNFGTFVYRYVELPGALPEPGRVDFVRITRGPDDHYRLALSLWQLADPADPASPAQLVAQPARDLAAEESARMQALFSQVKLYPLIAMAGAISIYPYHECDWDGQLYTSLHAAPDGSFLFMNMLSPETVTAVEAFVTDLARGG